MNAPVAHEFSAIFGPEGPLAGRIAGYRVRAQQIDMAEEVARAIRDCAKLVCEAGTGTGKTVAYLVPALISGGKVVISTGTKNLQDQLYQRDLPLVRDALNMSVTTALLKGRANYVCHHHLERNLGEARLATREDAAHLQRIARFARSSASSCGSPKCCRPGSICISDSPARSRASRASGRRTFRRTIPNTPGWRTNTRWASTSASFSCWR